MYSEDVILSQSALLNKQKNQRNTDNNNRGKEKKLHYYKSRYWCRQGQDRVFHHWVQQSLMCRCDQTWATVQPGTTGALVQTGLLYITCPLRGWTGAHCEQGVTTHTQNIHVHVHNTVYSSSSLFVLTAATTALLCRLIIINNNNAFPVWLALVSPR